uniref:Uncharacterized protein n=1 Tax=Arundo donax TaxID=35708 RepID=A0A0A9BBV5_ARUDO
MTRHQQRPLTVGPCSLWLLGVPILTGPSEHQSSSIAASATGFFS